MKLLKAVFSIYAFVVFVVAMFFYFPFICLCMFFGKVKGGNYLYKLLIAWSYTCLTLWGMRLKINRANLLPGNSPVIFIFNHLSYIDIPLLLISCSGRDMRILGKAELSKVPVFGFIYKYAVVMVDRSSAGARTRSVEIMNSTLQKNISVCIAPEGTFNETNQPLKPFYNGAFSISMQTNLPVQPLIFLNAVERLHYKSIFSFTPGVARAAFLPPSFPGNYANADALKEAIYNQMETYLVQHHAVWLTATA